MTAFLWRLRSTAAAAGNWTSCLSKSNWMLGFVSHQATLLSLLRCRPCSSGNRVERGLLKGHRGQFHRSRLINHGGLAEPPVTCDWTSTAW